MTAFYVYVLDSGLNTPKWLLIRKTENLKVAMDLLESNFKNGYNCQIEDEQGKVLNSRKVWSL